MVRFRCSNGYNQYPPKSKKCVPKGNIPTKGKSKTLKQPKRSPAKLIKSKIIGQGSYGCVYRPYIPCKIYNAKLHNMDSQNLISKFMLKRDAEKELEEFKFISKLDPNNKYHLGTPVMCQPDYNDPHIVKALEECYLSGSKPLYNPDKSQSFSVLTFPYGGLDLKDYCKQLTSSLSPDIVQEFWTKCVLNLFDGLEFFQKNGLIHYDLKPHNILFNEKKMQMRYIDFGLMMNMESFMNTSKENNNPLAIMHWSYPWANAFANADTFNKYVESSEVEKADYTRDFTNLIVDGKKSIDLYLLGLDVNHPSALNHVFDYLYTKEEMRKMVHDMSLYKTRISLKVDEFFQGLERFSTIPVEPHFVDTNKQGETVNLKFIVMVGASIDIYGLGFTLQYVLNNFYEKKLIKKSFYDDFTKLFATMYETDITKQQLSATFLKRRYAEMVKKRTYWS